jgi:hypothetical protein
MFILWFILILLTTIDCQSIGSMRLESDRRSNKSPLAKTIDDSLDRLISGFRRLFTLTSTNFVEKIKLNEKKLVDSERNLKLAAQILINKTIQINSDTSDKVKKDFAPYEAHIKKANEEATRLLKMNSFPDLKVANTSLISYKYRQYLQLMGSLSSDYNYFFSFSSAVWDIYMESFFADFYSDGPETVDTKVADYYSDTSYTGSGAYSYGSWDWGNYSDYDWNWNPSNSMDPFTFVWVLDDVNYALYLYMEEVGKVFSSLFTQLTSVKPILNTRLTGVPCGSFVNYDPINDPDAIQCFGHSFDTFEKNSKYVTSYLGTGTSEFVINILILLKNSFRGKILSLLCRLLKI